MKRQLYIYIIGVAALLVSCDIETSDNGNLDGFWQMTTKEHLLTCETEDMRDQMVSWAFQGALVQMNSQALEEVTGHFSHTGNSLKIWDLNHFTHADGDARIDSVEMLHVFGIYHLEQTFQVMELSKSTMRLRNDSVVLNFRKY